MASYWLDGLGGFCAWLKVTGMLFGLEIKKEQTVFFYFWPYYHKAFLCLKGLGEKQPKVKEPGVPLTRLNTPPTLTLARVKSPWRLAALYRPADVALSSFVLQLGVEGVFLSLLVCVWWSFS